MEGNNAQPNQEIRYPVEQAQLKKMCQVARHRAKRLYLSHFCLPICSLDSGCYLPMASSNNFFMECHSQATSTTLCCTCVAVRGLSNDLPSTRSPIPQGHRNGLQAILWPHGGLKMPT